LGIIPKLTKILQMSFKCNNIVKLIETFSDDLLNNKFVKGVLLSNFRTDRLKHNIKEMILWNKDRNSQDDVDLTVRICFIPKKTMHPV